MTEYKERDEGIEWQEEYAKRFEAIGYVALKLMIKNPGTWGVDRRQFGIWTPINDTIDFDKPFGEEPVLRDALTMLLERMMQAPPPSKQG